MPLSIGWIFLLGGVAGLIQSLRANAYVWGDSTVPMTGRLRLLAIATGVALVLGGAWKIQHDHWWNPFLGHPTDRQLTPRERDDLNGAISENIMPSF